MRYYEIITEVLSPAAIDATVNRYGQQIIDKLAKDRQGSAFKDDPSKLIQYVVDKIDPTTNSRYTRWIISRFVDPNGGISFVEDLSKLTEPLGRYAKLSQSGVIPAESRDINRIKSMDTFLDLMDQYAEKKTGREEKAGEEQELINSGQAVLYKDTGKVKIMIPKTEKAAKYYGRGTRWCTAGDNDNQFDYYNSQGPIYDIIFRGSGVKWQFQFEVGQFMDEQNKSLSPEQVSSVYDLFSEDTWIVAVKNHSIIHLIKNPSEAVQLAAVKKNIEEISNIKNPTEKVQLAAVTQNGFAIYYIIEKGITPSEQVQLAAVTNYVDAIQFIIEKGIIPSEQVQLAAVTKNGNVIEYIIKKGITPSEQVQLAAEQSKLAVVTKNGLEIEYIKNPSEKVQLAAVTQDGDAIEYIIKKGIIPSEQVQLAAVTNYGNAIEYIKNPSEAVKKVAGIA